jgi:hypothetical protein
MKRSLVALGTVLALGVFMPDVAAGQEQSLKVSRPGMSLGQNYPNPFNPETNIPFSVGDSTQCVARPGKLYRVSLRILNLLPQMIATPVLKGGAGGVSGGEPLANLQLPCGDYVAYWDGKVRGTSRDAASGVYAYVLDVDGKQLVKKMIVVK